MLAIYLHYGNGSLIVATSELLCVCCTAVRSLRHAKLIFPVLLCVLSYCGW